MRSLTTSEFAEEIWSGLTASGQKTLPAKYLYDEVGSALFDAITALPEYGLARADLRLLRAHASAIVQLCDGTTEVAELGSGNGSKTRILLAAFPSGVVYRPVDISRAALDRCAREMSEFHSEGIEADFLSGLERIAERRKPRGRMLTLFLGSNIGNLDRREITPFLGEIHRRLRPGDLLLVGADLLKPSDQLILAYDDPAGVTAAFNRNLLSRLNREVGANFAVRSFDHEARWNPELRRMEMHLRARSKQDIYMEGLNLDLTIRAGETIHTESSGKFEVSELVELAKPAGFRIIQSWTDSEWPFAEILFGAV